MSVVRLLLLVLLAATAFPAEAQHAVPLSDLPPVSKSGSALSGGEVLYNQTGNADADAFPSQDFQEVYDQFDCQGADDFVVPGGDVWELGQVDVVGAYRDGQLSPVSVANLYIYADEQGQPGAEVAAFTGVGVDDEDMDGDWSVVLPEAVTLMPGTYWVSVTADLDAIVDGMGDGQWFWLKQATASPIGGEVRWRNSGNGFETGCTDWSRLNTDCGDVGGLDASFRLLASLPVSNDSGPAPADLRVSPNYPNPFFAATRLDVTLPAASRLRVTIYDVLGREVEVLHDAFSTAGTHRVTWTASDVPSGIYLAHVESKAGHHTLRMTVAR